MVFSSLEFIFIFLPVFLLVYHNVSRRAQNLIVFAGSLIFYSYGVLETPIYILLMFVTILMNFITGQLIDYFRRAKRLLLLIGVCFNFFWLFIFKYTNFFIENTNSLFPSLNLPLRNLILPIGISFYTFQNVSYLADVYRGKVRAETSFIRYGAYITMFPQLIAGPIVTYDTVAQQLRKRTENLKKFDEGLRYFTLGLGSKVIIANQIGNLWTDIANIGFESISTKLAWLGIFAYSFQIYFDFYGYSLMAIGLGKLMGFELPKNFDNPYMSVTMTEFWRRWHITLGSWFREYVYIPLGGNRKGGGRTVFNLAVVWTLTGFWHGASWNFIIWGVGIFVIITLEKFVTGKFFNKVRPLGHLYMIFLIPMSWLVFAITDFSQLSIYFQRLFPIFFENGADLFPKDYVKYWDMYGKFFIAGIICSTPIPSLIYKKLKGSFIMTIVLLAVFWFSVYCMYIGLNDPFLYFRF
ncbi:MAG: MBOAT family protein [Oscillospiraceae bacterium]|nr:MBOAT family protein [Oscillospiraceae bacterium]